MSNDIEVIDLDSISPELLTNENYSVSIVEGADNNDYVEVGNIKYYSWYAVSNNKTGIVEHQCVALPEAYYYASSLNHALETKAYLPEEERPDRVQLVRPKLVN